jgi:hypothetical protein
VYLKLHTPTVKEITEMNRLLSLKHYCQLVLPFGLVYEAGQEMYLRDNLLRILINRKQLLVIRISYTLGVLVVFGSVFPPLAVIAGTGLMVVTCMDERVTAKVLENYGSLSQQPSVSGNPSIDEQRMHLWFYKYVNKECKDIDYVFPYVGKLIIGLSSLLYGAVIFDTYGDAAGWDKAIFPTIAIIIYPLSVYICIFCFKLFRVRLSSFRAY